MPNTSFEIKVENLSRLTKALQNYPSIAGPVLQKAIEGTGFIFEKNTIKNDPVPWRTGNLWASFRFRSSPGQARWFPTARYAPFVEFGTRPHIIRPVRARALSWESGRSAGYVTTSTGRRRYKTTKGTRVFARHVNHPGSKARPYMGAIVKKSEPEVGRLFGQAGDIITRDIAAASQ